MMKIVTERQKRNVAGEFMIRDDEDLALVRSQCACIERALESLRADVFPKNPRNFAVFSEGYVEQIDILKAEIDEYLWKRHLARTKRIRRRQSLMAPRRPDC